MGLKSAGSGVLHLDLRGSESRYPNPSDNCRVMLSAVKACISKQLGFFGSSVDRPEPGFPDPVDGGHRRCRRSFFGTTRVQKMQVTGVPRETTTVMKNIVLVVRKLAAGWLYMSWVPISDLVRPSLDDLPVCHGQGRCRFVQYVGFNACAMR